MMRRVRLGLFVLGFVCVPLAAFAQEDSEGCKDHPLFTRLPGFYISNCDVRQFDLVKFPKGALKEDAEGTKRPTPVSVEGPVWKIDYQLKDGMTKPSPLQIMRNFEAATKKAGGTIEGEYPGWCAGTVDDTLDVGNGCTNYGVSMKFVKGNKETFAYAQAGGEGESYELVIAEREEMKQDVVASELLDKIKSEGFVALYINFDTGKATIKPDSEEALNQAAAALESAPDLQIEVGGHTDNVGAAEANQKLSEERAKAVVAALVQRGVAASRLSAKGYGQSVPIADNRSEEGRAKNRRVELTRK